jgi:dynein light chain LC8-type
MGQNNCKHPEGKGNSKDKAKTFKAEIVMPDDTVEVKQFSAVPEQPKRAVQAKTDLYYGPLGTVTRGTGGEVLSMQDVGGVGGPVLIVAWNGFPNLGKVSVQPEHVEFKGPECVGGYVILHQAGVTEGKSLSDKLIGTLIAGTVVNVAEVVHDAVQQRWRGRITEPLSGWMSLLATDNGERWAFPCDGPTGAVTTGMTNMSQVGTGTIANRALAEPIHNNAGAAMFDAIDRNHDGVISRAEFAGAMGGSMGVQQPAPASVSILNQRSTSLGHGSQVMVVPGTPAYHPPPQVSTLIPASGSFQCPPSRAPSGVGMYSSIGSQQNIEASRSLVQDRCVRDSCDFAGEACKEPKVSASDMSKEMQQEAISCARQALKTYKVEKDIAAYVKKEFDKKYGAPWHCIVGQKFGSYVSHEDESFAYFYFGEVAFLLFKST